MESPAHNAPLPLRNAFNVRDLGGYACAGGGVTRERAFLRADCLSALTPDEVAFLLDYGVRTVIDLRSRGECIEHPSPFIASDEVAYLNLPLGLDRIDDISRYTTQAPEAALLTFYRELIVSRQSVLRQILETMAAARPGTVLFHCMAGKDRTGVIAALLLGLAGVSPADIVANYSTSGENIRHSPQVRQLMGSYAPELFDSPPAAMEALLAFIDREYGSLPRYLAGMDDADWSTLRQRLHARPRDHAHVSP